MEITIKNPSSRILLEKADNGVILYEIGEDNVVTSKIIYEMYFKDGIIDFSAIGIFMLEMVESLGIPLEEQETNRKLEIFINPIDGSNEDEPTEGEDDENED